MAIIKTLGIIIAIVILLIVLITSLEVLFKAIIEIFKGKGN